MQYEEQQKQQPTEFDPQQLVEEFNLKYAVGSPVVVWLGERRGAGLHTKTRSAAQLLGGHTPVVWVEDHPACVALTHVAPYNE